MLSTEALKCTLKESGVIEGIVERDRRTFEKWLEREENPLRLGFRFITGYNSREKIEIFTNHLGRYPVERIYEKYWRRVGFGLLFDSPDLFTVGFLRKEDKAEFLRPA